MDAEIVREQLELGLMSPQNLLAGTKLLEESSRNAGDYQDFNYLPFYYHLGKQLTPKFVFQIGSKLGLIGCCFLKGCKTVESWYVLDENKDAPKNIIASNLRSYSPISKGIFAGEDIDFVLTKSGRIDLGLLTENFGTERNLKYLNFLWKHLVPEGLLVVDYINSDDVFHEFCRVNNREPVIFNTRYGVGIIQR